MKKTATKKAIEKIESGAEPLASKRFGLCTQLRCPDCNAIMVMDWVGGFVYCCNPPCSSLDVKYRLPTITLIRK